MLNPSASFGVVIFGNVWAARVQADRAAAATSTRGWMGRAFMSESLYRMRPGPLRGDARLLRSPCFFPLTPTVSRCSLKYLAHVCSHQGHVTQAKGTWYAYRRKLNPERSPFRRAQGSKVSSQYKEEKKV